MLFYHSYDPATGELLELSVSATPEWRALQEQAGRTVAESQTYATPETHNYLGGALTAKRAGALTPDKTQITSGGADQAVVAVAVAGEDPPASLTLLVNGAAEAVALTHGAGSLAPIVAQTPCLVTVQVADSITYRAEPVAIQAV
ncbi:MAG: hypothetical protein AB1814_01920 [Thermodesulfobacteriota bacterium]